MLSKALSCAYSLASSMQSAHLESPSNVKGASKLLEPVEEDETKGDGGKSKRTRRCGARQNSVINIQHKQVGDSDVDDDFASASRSRPAARALG